MLNKTSAFIILPALFAATAVSPFSCSLARDGGVFRSDDFGASFAQKAAIEKNKNIGNNNVLSMETEPVNSNVVYMGTNGNGLYRSIDSGEIWRQILDKNNVLDKRASVYDIAISSQNTDLLYLAVVSNGSAKVLLSQDAGESFKEIYVISDSNQRINDIEINKINEAVIFIGTSEGGLLRSGDQGQSWQALKWFGNKIFAVKSDPKNIQIIYAVVENKGIFKSIDGGQNFEELKVKQKSGFSQFGSANNFLIDSFNSGILYASIGNQLFISSDFGQSWRAMNILIPSDSISITALAQDPQNQSTLYYSAGSVLYKTRTAGQTWTTQQIPSSRRINVIKIDSLDPSIVYVGMSQ